MALLISQNTEPFQWKHENSGQIFTHWYDRKSHQLPSIFVCIPKETV